MNSTRTTTDENIVNIFRKIKNQSEIQMQMSKLDMTSGRYGKDMYGIMFPENENLSTDDLSKSLISIETKVRINGLYETFIIGIFLETRHCLNPA